MSDAANVAQPAEKNLITSFVASGRTGRRNAMGDILDEGQRCVSTSALPQDLGALKISGAEGGQSSPQNESGNTASKQ